MLASQFQRLIPESSDKISLSYSLYINVGIYGMEVIVLLSRVANFVAPLPTAASPTFYICW
jgi:hypothetical protein